MTPIENGGYRPVSVARSGMMDSDGRRCTADEADAAWAAIGVFPVLVAYMTIPEIAECQRNHSLDRVFQLVGVNQAWAKECAK